MTDMSLIVLCSSVAAIIGIALGVMLPALAMVAMHVVNWGDPLLGVKLP